MDHKRIACGRTLIFHLLIVLGTCNFIPKETHALQVLQNLDVHYHGGGDDEATVHEVVQEKQKMDLHYSHSSSSQMMNSIDPGSSIFFNLKDLKLGKKMAICLEDEDSNPPLSSPYLLQTKKEADAIPFSLKQLPNILEYFSIPQGSRKAQVMEKTLQECEIKPIEGETKFCATSYESLVDLAREILGFETNIQVLSTTIDYPTRSTNNNVGKARVQEYTIVQLPQQISAPKMISCHTMHYPYLIIHCHSQLGNGINRKGNRIYRTSLLGENGEKVEALAVCHMDTSLWDHDHVSFRLLGIKPGTAPVCHFLPTQSFALLPSTTSSSIF